MLSQTELRQKRGIEISMMNEQIRRASDFEYFVNLNQSKKRNIELSKLFKVGVALAQITFIEVGLASTFTRFNFLST